MSGNKKIEDDKLIEILLAKTEEYKQQLLKILEASYYYRNVLEPRLVFWYESIFGDIESEIENKTRIATELERRTELLDMKVKRGEEITDQTIKYIDMLVVKETQRTAEFRAKADAENLEYNHPEPHFDVNNGYDGKNSNYKTTSDGGFYNPFETTGRSYTKSNSNNSNSNAFKNGWKFSINQGYNPFQHSFDENLREFQRDRQIPFLYRNIVKRLHPDIVGESEDFKRFWGIVQEAYKSKNLERLSIFYNTLCSEDTVEYPDKKQKMQALYNKLKGLELSVQIEKRKLEKLKTEEPFDLENKLSDRFWISRQKRALNDHLFQLNKRILNYRQTLHSLTGHRWNNDGVLESARSAMFSKNYYNSSYVASK